MNSMTIAELETLRAKIEAGIADADNGRFVDDSNEQTYLAEKLAQLHERMSARSTPPR